METESGDNGLTGGTAYMNNIKKPIFILLVIPILLMIASCQSSSPSISGGEEDDPINMPGENVPANIQEDGDPTDTPEEDYPANIQEGDDLYAILDKNLLDEMRREVLGIGEDEEIDYELFKSITEITIENNKGETEYNLGIHEQPPLTYHIQDISYLILFENVSLVQIYDVPITTIPDLTVLKKLNILLFSGCDVQSIDGLKNLKNITHLSIYNSTPNAVHIEDLYKIGNLGNLTEFFVRNALINDDDIAFLATDCPVSNSLERIDLGGNMLTSLAPFADMPKLRGIDCGFNKIGTPYIATNSQLANSLSVLTLDGNDISNLEDLSHLKKLHLLSVAWNNIKVFDIEKSSRIYDTLRYLIINGNELETLDRIIDLENLWELAIMSNSSLDLNQLKDAKFLDSLQKIYLDENAIIDEELLNRLPVRYSYPE